MFPIQAAVCQKHFQPPYISIERRKSKRFNFFFIFFVLGMFLSCEPGWQGGGALVFLSSFFSCL